MTLTVHSVETFDPVDLHVLHQAYRDAWGRLEPLVPDTAKRVVKDAVAVAIFDMARAGRRVPELLWCCAMREGKRAIEAQALYETRKVYAKRLL